MTLRVETEAVQLSKSLEITISEATWDSTFRLNQLEEEARSITDEDKTLGFFRGSLYPVMTCCASGNVPTAEEAYALPRAKLDEWYIAVWKLNPDMFNTVYHERASEAIAFRDDTKITVYENCGLPSFLLKLFELEQSAIDHPLEDVQAQVFNSSFYPKMGACVNGSKIPDVKTVLKWPRSELNKWFMAARRLNPDWFASLDQVSQMAAEEKNEKKSKKKRVGSSVG